MKKEWRQLCIEPNLSGVYRLLNSEKEIVYVGASTNVYKRVVQHTWSTKIWDTAEVLEIRTNNIDELWRVEKEHIMKYDPCYNAEVIVPADGMVFVGRGRDPFYLHGGIRNNSGIIINRGRTYYENCNKLKELG